MKRKLLYLYTLLLALISGGMLSSCSNEDIDIQRVGKLEVRVSTQKLYDTFNSTNSIKTRFLSDGYEIGVTVFVYNENGILVDEQFQHSKTFDSMSFYYPELSAGRYTFVVAETLVEEELNYKSDDWVFENSASLSTLEIKTNPESTIGDYHFWYSVVGSSSLTQYFDFEEDTRINITPEAIGSVIQYEAINFANTDYKAVKFLTKDTPAGRYLSPEYQGDDRFHYDSYLGSNTWNGRARAWIDDSEEMSGADAYLIESGNIHYIYGAFKDNGSGYLETTFTGWPKNGSTFSTSDGETYYGGIAYRETDGNVGCTTSLFNSLSTYNEWENEMLNTSTSSKNVEYVNPYIVWGASRTAVANYMKALAGATSFNSTLTNGNALSYINYKQTVQYDYYFDTNWSNLSMILMDFAKSEYSIETINNLITDLGLNLLSYEEELNSYVFFNTETSAVVYYPQEHPDDIYAVLIPAVASTPAHFMNKSGKLDTKVLKSLKIVSNNKTLRRETKSGR